MSVVTDINHTLNDLIQICLDGENGFKEAAEHVTDSSLKLELMDYSMQRKDFAADLKALVASTGEEPAHHGDLSASLHRAWIDVKSLFTSNDRHAVLAECERGEDAAVEAFRTAATSGLPNDYAQLIQSQFNAVKRTHDRIKALRDAAEKK